MMKLRRINISEKILQNRKKRIAEQDLLESVHQIFRDETLREEKILKILQDNNDFFDSNHFLPEKLQPDRIFHLDDIEKICTNYRLRFLNSALYRAELPYEAIIKIKEVEKDHDISLKGFKIMAPASVFKLKNADDPLLFAPIGNQYYYLIHSWGRDLHPLRKILMWPFRQLENFMLFLFALSLFFTCFVPSGMFSQDQTTTEFFILFFFMFKWITALAIFYGFKFGKNFSSAIWNSTYFNA